MLTLVAVLVLFVTVMVSSRAAHAVGGFIQRVAEAVLRLIRKPRELGLGDGHRPAAGPDQGRHAHRLVVHDARHHRVLQSSISCCSGCACTSAAWSSASAPCWRPSRSAGLLTSVAVTPGGLGVVEAGSVALLVAMGADPAQAAGGILLFTIFTHILEIPFGVMAWLFWLFGRGANGKRQGVGTARDRAKAVAAGVDEGAAARFEPATQRRRPSRADAGALITAACRTPR